MAVATGGVKELMRRYALRGFEEWKGLDRSLRNAAKGVVGGRIASDAGRVPQVIVGGTDPAFLPMRAMPALKKAGYEWCFFLPVAESGQLVALILLLFAVGDSEATEEGKSLAFRFEKGDPGTGLHEYWHMQFTQKVKLPSATGFAMEGVTHGLPDSWPAFPVPGESWLDVFLVMLTAVHGFPGGVDVVLQDLWQRAGRSDGARECMARLRAIGIVPPDWPGAQE